jgi:hypothetical protein
MGIGLCYSSTIQGPFPKLDVAGTGSTLGFFLVDASTRFLVAAALRILPDFSLIC